MARLFICATPVFLAAISFAASQTPSKSKHHPESAFIPLMTPKHSVAVASYIKMVVMVDLKVWNGPVPGGKPSLNNLGPESIPLLIEWMNYATAQGWTCPCTIIGKKLEHFMEYATRHHDIDTLEYMERKLWKGKKLDHPKTTQGILLFGPMMSLQSMARGGLQTARREKSLQLKKLDFADLMKLANDEKIENEALANTKFNTSPRLADWRMMVETIATKKDKEQAFDWLLKAMEESENAARRKVVHVAIVTWSGTDRGPVDFDSENSVVAAVQKWRVWRAEKQPKQNQ